MLKYTKVNENRLGWHIEFEVPVTAENFDEACQTAIDLAKVQCTAKNAVAINFVAMDIPVQVTQADAIEVKLALWKRWVAQDAINGGATEPKESGFNEHLAAIVTETAASDWRITASWLFDEHFGAPFEPLNSQVFTACQVEHMDGRIAQIETGLDDAVYLSCGDLSWSGVLEDDEVCMASKLSDQRRKHACISAKPGR